MIYLSRFEINLRLFRNPIHWIRDYMLYFWNYIHWSLKSLVTYSISSLWLHKSLSKVNLDFEERRPPVALSLFYFIVKYNIQNGRNPNFTYAFENFKKKLVHQLYNRKRKHVFILFSVHTFDIKYIILSTFFLQGEGIEFVYMLLYNLRDSLCGMATLRCG